MDYPDLIGMLIATLGNDGGAESEYTGLVQWARANFDAFRSQSCKTMLPSEEAARVREWVFAAAGRITRRQGFPRKPVLRSHRKRKTG